MFLYSMFALFGHVPAKTVPLSAVGEIRLLRPRDARNKEWPWCKEIFHSKNSSSSIVELEEV